MSEQSYSKFEDAYIRIGGRFLQLVGGAIILGAVGNAAYKIMTSSFDVTDGIVLAVGTAGTGVIALGNSLVETSQYRPEDYTNGQ